MQTDVDVVVVGAGFAGMTAARQLQKAGRSVAVVEARDRVGGRTDTVEVEGVPVDLGGQWVGPGQERLYKLAADVGVATFAQHDTGDSVIVRDGKGTRVPSYLEAFSQEGLEDYLTAGAILDELVAATDVEAPWRTPDAARLDAVTLESWAADNFKTAEARDLLRLGIEGVFATEPANISVLHFCVYAAAGGGWERLISTTGGAQQDRFVGGVAAISGAVASRLGDSLTLGAAIRRIDDRDGVIVHHDHGTVKAERAIVAIPPTLAGRIDYRPALPGTRDQLTQRMPQGSVIKFHVIYESPWWRDVGLSGQVLGIGGPIDVTFDCSPPDLSRGVITGFFEGTQAIKAATDGENGRREKVVAVLTQAFGDRAAAPLAYVDRDWGAEPFTRGCYGAHMPPGAWTQLGPALRAPVGRIHWAGTETATQWIGYIDGAIESGERAAAEVLEAL